MIKFIATDLDGTLLNDKKKLPHDFSTIVDELDKRGIMLALSSGRQYDSIIGQFEAYKDKITVIAENGGLVVVKGETIFCDPMDNNDAQAILKDVLAEPGLYPIACGVDGAFGNAENAAHINNVIMYYRNYRTVPDVVAAVPGEAILKIAVYDDEPSEKHCYRILEKYHNTHNVLVSGKHWLDVMKKGTTKGSAIEHIQRVYGFKPEECMAFGDYMNDADMMRVCRHSYAMANAHPDLKSLCSFTAPSNNDEGVTKTIKEIVLN